MVIPPWIETLCYTRVVKTGLFRMKVLLHQNSTHLSILSFAGWLMVSLIACTAVTDVHLLHFFSSSLFSQIPLSRCLKAIPVSL